MCRQPLRSKEDQNVEEEEEVGRKSKDQFMKELGPNLRMLDSIVEMLFP